MVVMLTAVGVLVTNQPFRVAEASPPMLAPQGATPTPSTTDSLSPASSNTSSAPGPLASGNPSPKAVPPPPPGAEPGPGRIWTLTASKLILSGTQFHGIETQQVCGKPVPVLHFTLSKLQITDLVQRGQLLDGVMVTAAAAPGSVSTVTNGPIELYTISLTGTLNVLGFPIIPITLSANGIFPPNLDLSFLMLPDITFTNVVVRNVDLNHGILTIPGSHIFTSRNNIISCP